MSEVLRVKRLADIQKKKSILEVGDAGVKVRWLKGEKKLCIVSIRVMV